MEAYESIISAIALALGASWASGINLYAVLVVLGLGGATGNVALPEELNVLQNPLVIGAAGLMYMVEFVADKTPGVDTVWDSLHTFIRIPAGAMLAAGAIGDVTPAMEIAAAIVGGGLASSTHATKASSRLLINTSPEPFSNWGASLSEDLLVIAGLWTALNHPIVFLVLLVLFIALMIWLLPRIWRLIKTVFRKIGEFLGLVEKQAAETPIPENQTVKENQNVAELPPASVPSAATTTPPAATSENPQNAIDEIERLHQLRSKGVITEEEFLALKAKAIG